MVGGRIKSPDEHAREKTSFNNQNLHPTRKMEASFHHSVHQGFYFWLMKQVLVTTISS
jgi:hypothetical protein